MTLIFDYISILFLCLVSAISARVLVYRSEYIKGDPNINRFIRLVLLFVISIGALIFSPNFVRILLG